MSQVITKPITFSFPVEASENINQVAAARIFGKADFLNPEYMLQIEKKSDQDVS